MCDTARLKISIRAEWRTEKKHKKRKKMKRGRHDEMHDHFNKRKCFSSICMQAQMPVKDGDTFTGYQVKKLIENLYRLFHSELDDQYACFIRYLDAKIDSKSCSYVS